MSTEAAFRERAKEVRAYLSFLESLEKMPLVPGPRVWRGTRMIRASRASAFLMIYNSVEYGLREALVAVRSSILMQGADWNRLRPYWRREIVRAHFASRLRDGTNHFDLLDDVAEFPPGPLTWRNKDRDLPFSGSVDHFKLIKLTKMIDAKWRPPKGSLGGSDLALVKQIRNDLSHGEESFEDVGSNYTTQDLIDKFERIRRFMVSFLKRVDRYVAQQSWQRAA